MTNRQAAILCAVKAARTAAKTARQLEALGHPTYAVQARKLARLNIDSARRLKGGAKLPSEVR